MRFLLRAAVPTIHLRLAEHQMEGNGHTMMLEDNSAAIAQLLSDWALPHTTRARP